MSSERAFGSRFSRGGRLRRLWAAAVDEPDPVRAVERMREAAAGFARNPSIAVEVWPDFLESMLDARLLPVLTEADFDTLATYGEQNAQAAADDGAAGPPGTVLLAAWRPLVRARHARGELDAAVALLTRLCRSPHADDHARAEAADDLAALGAVGPEQLSIYADVLGRPARPPDGVAALVTDLLAVEHDAGTIRIAQAAKVADLLARSGATHPDLDRVLGLHRLLVDGVAHEAVATLTRAWRARPGDGGAFAGLLAALLRSGDHAQLARMAADPARPPLRAADELIQLSQVLAWLDDPAEPGPAPADADRLTRYTVTALAGEWLDYAIGRLYLLEGDSLRAAELLPPLAEAYPGRPGWDYHAAWALILRDDRVGVAHRFDRVRGRPGAWAVGCLLRDVDPAAAPDTAAPDTYAELAEARTELIKGGRPRAEPPSWLADGGALADHLEALRTVLALRFARHNRYALDQAMALPLFQRLPAPERLLWSGVTALLDRPDQARELLTEAARTHGYGRAALVLATHDAQDGQTASALRLLDEHGVPSGPKADLLRTWLTVSLDNSATVDELERLTVHPLPKARYSVGHLRLHQAVREQDRGRPDEATRLALKAKEDFDAAAEAGHRLIPPDTRALATAADLFATGHAETADLSKLRRKATANSWATWILGLAELTTHQPATHQPDSHQPGAHELRDNQSAAHQPGSHQFGVHQPDAQQSGVPQPGAHQSGSHQPGAQQSGNNQPGADRPGSDRSDSQLPGSHQPAAHQASSLQPGSHQAGFHQSGRDQPGAHQASSPQPGGLQPSSHQPSAHRSGSRQSGAQQFGSNQPGAAQSGSDPSGNQLPGGHQPAAHQASSLQPSSGRSGVQQRRSGQRNVDQLGGDRLGADLDLALCGQLVTQLHSVRPLPAASAVAALVGVLTRAVVLAGDGELAVTLSGMVSGLASLAVSPDAGDLPPAGDPVLDAGPHDLGRLLRLSRAAALRGAPTPGGSGQVLTDVPGALVVARHALARGDRAEGLRLLGEAVPADAGEARIHGILVAGLGGAPVEDPAPPDGAPTPVAAALRLVQAAGLAGTDPDRGRALLLEAAAAHDITGLVNLSRVMPALCAAPGRGGGARPRELAAVLRTVSATVPFDPLTLARCATAVGDHETADRAWRDALRAAGPGENDVVRQEYGRFLCHRATAAWRRGDPLNAVRLLRKGAGILDGHEPEQFLPDEDEVDAVRRLYEERLANLTGTRARVLTAEWGRALQRFRSLATSGNVAKALQHFEEMQALAHTGSLRGRWES
ncbi:hypothetical protein D0T12_01635 [Actinomadura spongiicola]|uniref:Uncharacterized protein n=1 Tax=Actinomadura spongiicola TaxID=2303421 RepID=A0A372GNT5_9ACTN|nr:hypothetical protein [Actinomadura spongiicola]RFS86985.1 hypothetical protein D0T12_01635 [Actinomadura spongiicola]